MVARWAMLGLCGVKAAFWAIPPERAVGLERGRALGAGAVQIGHEAPRLLDAVQDLGRGSRRGGSFVKRESVDHFSSPFLNTERCGRTIIHSPTLRQTRRSDIIHSGGEWTSLRQMSRRFRQVERSFRGASPL